MCRHTPDVQSETAGSSATPSAHPARVQRALWLLTQLADAVVAAGPSAAQPVRPAQGTATGACCGPVPESHAGKRKANRQHSRPAKKGAGAAVQAVHAEIARGTAQPRWCASGTVRHCPLLLLRLACLLKHAGTDIIPLLPAVRLLASGPTSICRQTVFYQYLCALAGICWFQDCHSSCCVSCKVQRLRPGCTVAPANTHLDPMSHHAASLEAHAKTACSPGVQPAHMYAQLCISTLLLACRGGTAACV